MLHFFLECTIRAALIVGATALVLYAMRVRVASVKHRVWTAVLLLMLALPLWIAWGPKAPIRILPANVENFAADVLVQTPPPSKAPLQKTDTLQATPAPVQPLLSPLEWSFLGLYLFGALIFLARLAIGTSKARRLVRESSPFGFPVGDEVFALVSGMLAVNKEKSRHADTHLVSIRHPEQHPYLRALRRTSLAFLSRAAGRAIPTSNRPHRIRISSACAAPVTVGFFRPTILLPENWCEWSASQLAAVLAHESEHARRCDPLVQWLALFNRAIFWFHPAAWWLERELSALAEECCDAAVLAQGHDPGAYAETLMHMARAIMHSGARVNATGTAMPGPRLPHRISRITETVPITRISRARVAFLIAICVMTCTAIAAGTLARRQSYQAQSSQNSASSPADQPTFEAISIKVNKSSSARNSLWPNQNGGRLRAVNFSLAGLVTYAYQLPSNRILGAPDWFGSEHFDIDATASSEDNVTGNRGRIKAMLADRFKFAVHHETRDLPVYALVLDKPGQLGPQLRASDGNCGTWHATDVSKPNAASTSNSTADDLNCGDTSGSTSRLRARFLGHGVSLQGLVEALSGMPSYQFVERPIVDRTGLTGKIDFELEFTRPQLVPSNESSENDPSAPPPFTAALREELGLKLEPATAPVDVLVIDHVEQPTPN